MNLHANFKDLQCTDDDNRSYGNVCNMSLISFWLGVIFIMKFQGALQMGQK